MRVRVVGSGIAGIASAIRLAAQGHDVIVHEANSYPGGKLAEWKASGYRFDMGPSLFTMPQFVEELFNLSGKRMTDYFQYIQWPTSCHYFFEDGTFLPFPSDTEQLVQRIEEVLKVSGKPLRKHLKRSAFIYRKTHVPFLERSLHRVKNHLTVDTLKAVGAIPKLHLFTTMHELNRKKLNHPKLVQIFDRFATYNGSNPFQAPGILHVIPHLEHGFGTFFPVGGMRSIVTSLVKLAEDCGVTFECQSKVDKIEVNQNRVTGLVANGKLLPADAVVCNADVHAAYAHLLGELPKPKRILAQERSSSALIFYWGVNRQFDQLDLHNIFFSEDYQQEFKTIFEGMTVPEDPTVYIHVSSKACSEDAPEGKESWFVMINVPANSGQDWQQLRLVARERILHKLKRMLHVDIEPLIEVEDYLDPVRIEQRTSSAGGALYGTSSNDRMATFFRHPNVSRIKNLLFVGGSVHPGGGIPLCLLSAKIATSEWQPV
jgi:phytoene desaturase